MKTCPSCKSEVSDLALRCKYCSNPLPQDEVKKTNVKEKLSSEPKGGAGKMFVMVGVGFVAGFLVALLVLPRLNLAQNEVTEDSKKTDEPTLSVVEKPAPKAEEKPVTKPVSQPTEPNFIVVNGKVIPNPKKSPSTSLRTSPAPLGPATGGEPDYISVNGKVVPNPKKQQ